MGLGSGPGSGHKKSLRSPAQEGRIFSNNNSFLFHGKPSGTNVDGKLFGGSVSVVISKVVFGPSNMVWQITWSLLERSLLNSKWLYDVIFYIVFHFFFGYRSWIMNNCHHIGKKTSFGDPDFFFKSPKGQSQANFVWPTGRNDNVISVFKPWKIRYFKKPVALLFLFCATKFSACKYRFLSPTPKFSK